MHGRNQGDAVAGDAVLLQHRCSGCAANVFKPYSFMIAPWHPISPKISPPHKTRTPHQPRVRGNDACACEQDGTARGAVLLFCHNPIFAPSYAPQQLCLSCHHAPSGAAALSYASFVVRRPFHLFHHQDSQICTSALIVAVRACLVCTMRHSQV